MWSTIPILALALFSSAILTGVVRRYALRKGILDIPNARSSHTKITPRGGGMAIAFVFLAGLGLLGWKGLVAGPVALALVGGGILVAAVGWLDDKRGLSAKTRAVVHCMAAVWAVYHLGGFPRLAIGIGQLYLGIGGGVLAVIGIVWMINLYNFMDGIDGLAAGEAVLVAVAGGVLFLARGNAGLALTAWLLASAAGGFLVWNWPPARIFMGDVSSGLLGFSFGTLAIAGENAGAVPALVWVLLLSAFVVDATATLVRRIISGEKWYDAHRTHGYQLAVAAGNSHLRVTILILGLGFACASAAWAIREWNSLLVPALAVSLGLHVLLWWKVTSTWLPERRGVKARETGSRV